MNARLAEAGLAPLPDMDMLYPDILLEMMRDSEAALRGSGILKRVAWRMPDSCFQVPGYWMNETSGVLRPAIEAYLLADDPMTPEHVAAMRAYLRQWMASPAWQEADNLRAAIDGLTSREAISRWLNDALDVGIDPL